MIIHVTKRHIQAANRSDACFKNPVCLAIAESNGFPVPAFIRRASGKYLSSLVDWSYMNNVYHVPRSVDRFMSKWLNRKSVRPFKFRLVVREKVTSWKALTGETT